MLTPVISTLFIGFIIYTDYHSSSQLSIGKIIAYSVILIVVLGPFFFLFYNHLNFALQTRLVFLEDKFEIIQYDKSFVFNVSEIIEVIQYSTDSKYSSGKLWWGEIMKWEVKTLNSEFVISSQLFHRLILKSVLKMRSLTRYLTSQFYSTV